MRRAGGGLPTIAGRVPELVDMPTGCPFADRCAYVVAGVPRSDRRRAVEVGPAHRARCIRLDAVLPLDGVQETCSTTSQRRGDGATTSLLEVENLTRVYRLPRERVLQPPPLVHALTA